ncbi:MAG: hypothetical protein F4Z85_12250 [Gemmatimonadetes bacterium]|nr:hypothetical protein [Gemmatimonadota bacterium]
MWLCQIAGSSYADHDLDIYSFQDIFVFDVLEKDGRTINFVSLRDSIDLAIVGSVTTGRHFPLCSYGHYKEGLLVSFHDRLEFYDVSDPSMPRLEQVLVLKDQEGKHLFWSKIAKLGTQFFVLAKQLESQHELTGPKWRQQVFELQQGPTRSEWAIQRMGDPPEIGSEHVMMSMFPSFAFSPRDEWPFVVRKTERFRYEVGWQVRRFKDYSIHDKFLWKIRREDGAIVSSLKLGEIMETICYD